jgi:hypothetical protein
MHTKLTFIALPACLFAFACCNGRSTSAGRNALGDGGADAAQFGGRGDSLNRDAATALDSAPSLADSANCLAAVACVGKCAGREDDCLTMCENAASQQTQQVALKLFNCANDKKCEDSACVKLNCVQEIAACKAN